MGSTLTETPSVSIANHPIHPLKAQNLDTEALTHKYQQERAKRLRADGVAQFKPPQGTLSHFKQDTWAPPLIRDPISSETKVLIVGAGLAGLVTSVKLKAQGVDDFLIVDKGAGFGGTWYWNHYPGVACDVESLIYLPFLEETGYRPKDRFSSGREICEHVSRIVEKWDLTPKAHLQTEITSVVWDESLLRWHVYTNRSDHFISQFVVLATGTLHEPKLPGFPGIEDFKGDHFHSGRWDYDVSGGDATGNMKNLSDKTVGIVGTGASAIQIIPKLAQDAKKLYVFQRTPSTVSIRDNHPIDPAISASLEPGWQTARMKDFADILQGEVSDKECTALEGLEALTMNAIFKEAQESGLAVQPSEIPELFQLADFRLMESIRKLVEDTVKDKETAEKLKPWYGFMCKRPTFNNDYLSSFNKANVELIDTNGKGVSRLTETGVIANGKEYEVDLLIYSTGFNFEVESDFHRRTGIRIIGTKDRTLDETWESGGPCTLFGLHVPEFPNLFIIGPCQAGVTANWTHTVYVAGDHIAEVVATCLREGAFQAIEPTEEAAEGWAKQIEEGSETRLQFAKTCPPGYFNREGKPEEIPARWGFYPKGITAWANTMREWREEGNMKGMEKR